MVGHVAFGPLRPHAPRLDGDDFDVPLRLKLFVQALTESLEGCKRTFSSKLFYAMKQAQTHTELACRVEGKGGVPVETTDGRYVDNTTGRSLVFAKVLHGLEMWSETPMR